MGRGPADDCGGRSALFFAFCFLLALMIIFPTNISPKNPNLTRPGSMVAM